MEGEAHAAALRSAGHTLVGVGDAYVGRVAELQAAVNGPLLARRAKLLQQVRVRAQGPGPRVWP